MVASWTTRDVWQHVKTVIYPLYDSSAVTTQNATSNSFTFSSLVLGRAYNTSFTVHSHGLDSTLVYEVDSLYPCAAGNYKYPFECEY